MSLVALVFYDRDYSPCRATKKYKVVVGAPINIGRFPRFRRAEARKFDVSYPTYLGRGPGCICVGGCSCAGYSDLRASQLWAFRGTTGGGVDYGGSCEVWQTLCWTASTKPRFTLMVLTIRLIFIFRHMRYQSLFSCTTTTPGVAPS